MKTSAQAIDWLQENLYNVHIISFDHDLGGDDTTIPVIQYIEQRVFQEGVEPPDMAVHSMNPVGRRNLQAAIDQINYLYERNT